MSNVSLLKPKLNQAAIDWTNKLLQRLEAGEEIEFVCLVANKEEYSTTWHGFKGGKFKAIGMLHAAASDLAEATE